MLDSNLLDLFVVGFLLCGTAIVLNHLYARRGKKDFQQWELGDSCHKHKGAQYRRNFGMADVRTLRIEK